MISWKFDINNQEESYLFCANAVKKGFYQKHKFYLLPSLPEKFRHTVVTLPKTSYLKRCGTGKNLLLQKPTKEEKKEILKLAQKVYKKQKYNLSKTEDDFSKTLDIFNKKLVKMFPLANRFQIIISPAMFGSVGSYRFEKEKIIVKPRYDRKIQNIYKLIVHALTHLFYFDPNNLNIKSKKWAEKQNLSFENYERLNLNYYFNTQKSLLSSLNNNHCGRLAMQSLEFFNWLNTPIKSVSINASSFTANELEIYNLLKQKSGKVITIEEIANQLWQENIDTKFSLYAISKTMQRLRSKLKNQTGHNLIHSQRGKGYILYN